MMSLHRVEPNSLSNFEQKVKDGSRDNFCFSFSLMLSSSYASAIPIKHPDTAPQVSPLKAIPGREAR